MTESPRQTRPSPSNGGAPFLIEEAVEDFRRVDGLSEDQIAQLVGVLEHLGVPHQEAAPSAPAEPDRARLSALWDLPEDEISREVLNLLKVPGIDHATRRQLVIEAEVVRFSPPHKEALLHLLRDFIEKYRDSNDRQDQIAVGSAIRKYVACMNVADVGSVGLLLEAGQRGEPPLEIKLVIVKMIGRKFAANPPLAPNAEPELADKVFELAEASLFRHVLPEGKWAAMGLEAVHALAAMLSSKAEIAIDLVNRLPYKWFRDHLSLVLKDLEKKWEQSPKIPDRLGALERLRTLIEKVDAS